MTEPFDSDQVDPITTAPTAAAQAAVNSNRVGAVVAQITACQSTLYAYVCALLGKTNGAADVLQEANLVLWQKADEFDPDRPFMPWAYKIAYFQVLAHRKRQSRDKLLFNDDLLQQISNTFCQDDMGASRITALDGCVEKLPVRHRQVVDARYRNGESVDSIARRLGKAPNALAAELYRIRKTLMDCVRNTLSAEGVV